MSRKSRANVRNARRNARMTLAAGIGLLLFIGWMGTMLLFQRASLRPVDQREAIPLETSLVKAEKTWSRRFRGARRQDGYRLYVADGVPLTGQSEGRKFSVDDATSLYVPFEWENLRGAEDWPAGTELTLLLDPRSPSEILALSRDGVELIRFEDAMAARARQYEGNLRMAVICCAADGVGAAALTVWYRRKMKRIAKSRAGI